MLFASTADASIWAYIAIPFISGFVGWFTNVIAIKMMFMPVEFKGISPYFGWQGIIPGRAEKMATLCVDMMTDKLLSVKDIFSKVDAKRVSQELAPTLNKVVREVTDEVISEHYPRLWETIPHRIKDRTYKRIQQDMPEIIDSILEDMMPRIEEYCDIRTLVIQAFVRNKVLLNDLFWRCGDKEFQFIGRSGLYFGFLFGLIQMVFWIFIQPWWFLPLAGLFVGFATNWLALKMIFEPLEPKKVLGLVEWQGLFLKRQEAVSEEYAAFFAKEILSSQNLLDTIFRGGASDQLFTMIQRHLKRAIDDVSGMSKPFIQMAVGTKRYIQMKNRLCDRLLEEFPKYMSLLNNYAQEALELEEVIRSNMMKLSSAEFERVLHPIFEEDEWILIAVGAALGLAAGFFQLFYLFGG